MASGPIACPCCETWMQPYFSRSVELDQCGSCGGVWFDGGELERVVGHALVVQCTQLQYRKCPRCDQKMKRGVLGKITVESCDGCRGFFLDAGELELLAGERLEAAKHPGGAPEEDEAPLDFVCAKCTGRFPIKESYSVPGGRICDKCSGIVPGRREPSRFELFLVGFVEAMSTGRRGRWR